MDHPTRNPFRSRPVIAGLALALIYCGEPSSQSQPPSDTPPNAAFTSSCAELNCNFTDGSTDPDGTIVSRMWDYGDGSSLSDVAAHTYASGGSYRITLTVTDDAGARAATTNEVTVSATTPPPPPNIPPTAAFTSSCNALTCTFSDASTDGDGTVASHIWNFGDGAASTTASPAHTYAASGTYSVSLTVVDNDGASGSVSHEVTAAANPDAIFIGAGDIAGCNSTYKDEATAAIIAQYPAATVYTVGDNAYPDGAATDYSQCYAPSWGKFKNRTHPAPGNHDYHQAGAAPYFGYFGANAGPTGRGYYSYDVGSWHIVSLNSEIDVSATGSQATWLKQDLAAHPNACTLAYWHRPLFTSGSLHAGATAMASLFGILYDAGAEIVLSGHNHQYERYAPQKATGTRDDARGIREFVAGSGGAELYDFGPATSNSEARYKGFGVLKLTLRATSYAWEFLPIAGTSFTDAGSGACH
jgi:phage baseplate assembly protein gpV